MKTSNYSTSLTVTTDPLELDTPILDAMGTITYNSAVINWLPVDNVQGYKIYLENTDDALVILDDLDAGDVTTYTLTGLYQNTNYQYKVKAYYNLLESAYSVADDFVTTDFVILPPTINANTELTFTKFAGNLIFSTLNLQDQSSLNPYIGAYTYSGSPPWNVPFTGESPDANFARFAIDDIARDSSYHSQDWSNISSKL